MILSCSGRCHGRWSLCQTVTRFAWQRPSWPTASCSSVSHCVPCHEVCMTRSPFAWWKVNFCYYLTPPPPPPSASRDTEAVIEIIDKTPPLLPNSHAVLCVVNIVQALHLNTAFGTSSPLVHIFILFCAYPTFIIKPMMRSWSWGSFNELTADTLHNTRHQLTAFHREEHNLSLFGIWNEIYRIY